MKRLSVARLLACNPDMLVGAQNRLFLNYVLGSIQLINICVSSLHQGKSGRLLHSVGSVFNDSKILIVFIPGAC